MKLHDRIREIRLEKNLSQDFIAYEMNLSQSQYSRRENGIIQFQADEILKLSKILETPVNDFFKDENVVLNNHHQASGTFAYHNHNISISEKLIEQYEARLKEKDELIALLKRKISNI